MSEEMHILGSMQSGVITRVTVWGQHPGSEHRACSCAATETAAPHQSAALSYWYSHPV